MNRFRLAVLFVSTALLTCSYNSLGQNATDVYRTSDGGTREVLESIFIPPIANAPFSLTLETEWSRPLNGGGSYALVNTRHIMRDSAGRIYQERWILVPKDGKIKSTMNWIQIADPEKHVYTTAGWRANCALRGLTAIRQPRLTSRRSAPPDRCRKTPVLRSMKTWEMETRQAL